ncbi:MAG: hypothetical protein PGN15_04615 [Aeromicrobium erythreum]
MPIPDCIEGPDGYPVLPVGRHKATLAEVEERFVDSRPDAADRREIFDDWLAFRDMQNQVGISVRAYWLNGGFITEKNGTSDIDFVTVIDGASPPPPDIQAALPWVDPGRLYQQQPAPVLGRTLRVDAYAMVKVGHAHPAAVKYAANYKYWDEWFRTLEVTGSGLVKGFVEVQP